MQTRPVAPSPLDRYVPAAAVLAALSALLIIFFGR